MNNVRTLGIDVSHWSGKIEWEKVVAKLTPQFVFVAAYHMKETAASSVPDARFADEYWPALQQLEIPRGAYLYCDHAEAADRLSEESRQTVGIAELNNRLRQPNYARACACKFGRYNNLG